MSSSVVPLVSVIVPSFRHEQFISGALESVRAQTYPNVELIVVDDASPDGTYQQAAAWLTSADADSRFQSVKLLRNAENIGAHASINRGCEHASGQFIALLNSDDMFHPRRLERLLAPLVAGRGELSFSRVVPVDDAGDYISDARLPVQLRTAFHGADWAAANARDVRAALLQSNIAISTGNLIFSKRIFNALGPFADLKYVHDWDFVLRSTLFADPIYVADDLYFYRIHGSNSFSSLADVAVIETHVVLARFAAMERARAPRAISPLSAKEKSYGH